MGTYAYTHTDTNICKLTGFSPAFISFLSINNNNNNTYQLAYVSLNDLLLNY